MNEISTAERSIDVNFVATRWLTYLLFAAGTVVYFLLPIWAGIFSEDYAFTGKQVGFLLSADMTANTIAAFTARYWIHRCQWRTVLPLTVIAAAIPNFVCVFVDGYWPLMGLRFVAGFGAGLMTAFVYVIIAASRNPDREFAYALATQTAVGAAFLFGTTALLTTWGVGALFVVMGIATLLPLALLRAVPPRNPLAAQTGDSEQASKKLGRGMLGALVGVGVFFVAMNVFWVSMERLGDARGLSLEFITMTLSYTLLFSFAGALVPAWLAKKSRRIVPIFIAYVVLFAAVVWLISSHGAVTYFIALCVYNFCYSFIIPFQSGWVANHDKTGRTVVLLPVVQGIGISLGPILAGLVVSGADYDRGVQMGIVVLGLGYAIWAYSTRRTKTVAVETVR